MKDPLLYRDPQLVATILGHVYDSDRPVPWNELLELDLGPWRTVEATVHDLIAYGALHRVGKAGDRKRPDTRALKPTPLGRAWLNRAAAPWPWALNDEGPAE